MLEKYFERKDRYNVVIDITPTFAEAVLSQCNGHNRKLIDAHAERLSQEMKAGRWWLSHQGIAFSPNRVLLDGQHRLWAVILSGVTVPMRVFFNEPGESLNVIDVVQARRSDEVLTLAGGLGVVNRAELATLRAMVTGLGTYHRMSPGAEAEILAKHREAIAFAHEILPAARYAGVATAVTRAVLARAFYSVDRASLRHFADVLQSATAFSENDQPITMLLKFLLVDAVQNRHGRPETRERYGKTERALAAYLMGDSLSKLYAASMELFPLPGELETEAA